MATDRHDAIAAGVRRAAMLRVRRGHNYAFDFGPVTLTESPAAAGAPPAYARRRTELDKLLADAAGEARAGVREGFTIADDLALIRAGWPYAGLGTSKTTAEGSRFPVHDRKSGHCLGRAGSVE